MASLQSTKTIVSAVDGSEMAHRAFQIAMHIRQSQDRLIVLHCADRRKEFLPRDLKPEHIMEFYENELIAAMLPEKYEIVIQYKEASQNTRDIVVGYVNRISANFLVTGYVGRKGPKLDPTVLGSCTDMCLRQANSNNVIVKRGSTLPEHGNPTNIIVGVDGSENSHKAFLCALSIAKTGDRISIIHIWDIDSESEIEPEFRKAAVQEKYESLVSHHPEINIECISRQKHAGVPRSRTLLEIYEETEGHFIVVGADGVSAWREGKSTLGSTSDAVLRHSKGTVVVARTSN